MPWLTARPSTSPTGPRRCWRSARAARATATDSRRTCAICRSASCRTWSAACAAARSAAARSRVPHVPHHRGHRARYGARSRSASGVPSSGAGTSSPPSGPSPPRPSPAAAGITVAARCPTHCSAATSCRVSRSACSRSSSARRRAWTLLRRKCHAGPDSGHRQHGGGGHYQFSHQVLTDRKPSVWGSGPRARRGRGGGGAAGGDVCGDACGPRQGRNGPAAAGARHGPPRTCKGRYELGADDDADSERHRTAHPYRLELLNPRPAFDVREGTIPLALTRRVSLVTTSRNHRRFDAKNARMAAEALWLEKSVGGTDATLIGRSVAVPWPDGPMGRWADGPMGRWADGPMLPMAR